MIYNKFGVKIIHWVWFFVKFWTFWCFIIIKKVWLRVNYYKSTMIKRVAYIFDGISTIFMILAIIFDILSLLTQKMPKRQNSS